MHSGYVASILQWAPSGEVLAILPAGNSFVLLWSMATHEIQRLETDFKVIEWVVLGDAIIIIICLGSLFGMFAFFVSLKIRTTSRSYGIPLGVR